jgi:hypothetical protein
LLEDISADIHLDGFHWLVAGGESGAGNEHQWDSAKDWKVELNNESGRRTTRYEWAAHLRDKVKAAGLSFMFKQVTVPKSGFGHNALDGQDWHEFPPAPNGLAWAERQPIPDKYKMIKQQWHDFKAHITPKARTESEAFCKAQLRRIKQPSHTELHAMLLSGRFGNPIALEPYNSSWRCLGICAEAGRP